MLNIADFKKKQIIFVFTNEGDKLSFKNDNVVVMDKNKKIKYQSTCYRLFLVGIVGNVSITSGLIQRANKFGFGICLMNQSLRTYEYVGCCIDGNTLLKKCQYEYNGNEIGQHIIKNKIENQRNVLIKQRSKTDDVKEAVNKLNTYIDKLSGSILEYREIMGLEGSASRVYFPCVFNNVAWHGRKPRIKSDYINSILDIGYTILFNFVDALLNIYGFDTYYGVFHKCFYMRKSLVCDIMEVFRPVIDYQIRKSINLGQFKMEHFRNENKRWVLDWKYNPEYVTIFITALLEYKEEMFMYIQAYYRSFMRKKEIEQYPEFIIK